MLRSRWSRYVVDVNRDPAGVSLYPGARTTGLVPLETFEGEPLYAPGDEPNEGDRGAASRRYFEPYHDALQGELARLRHQHGSVLLLDAHSIWSPLPLLFAGELPDVNVGTNSGRSCDPVLRDAAERVVAASPYSVVVDGRFKGGYITRRYGNPAHGAHAIQLEINQKTYLADGSRTAWDDAKAAQLSAVLRAVCDELLARLASLRSSEAVG